MSKNWTTICKLTDIAPNTGVCAQVKGQQVAIFRVANNDELFAINNFDPIGKANVLSRGLLAHLKDDTFITSPLYKQHYRLTDGQCLEDSSIKITTYEIRVKEGQVEVEA